MTEEEIKEQLVLPRLLKRLGYRSLQMRREAVVRTGTTLVRADLVFYDGGTPYLVVETKAPDKISPDSTQQAESYAILLHAPYFLVTDGHRWRWYRTGRSGGGSSQLLDCEILPHHRRSRFFLHEVERPGSAPRVEPSVTPPLQEASRVPTLPGFVGPEAAAPTLRQTSLLPPLLVPTAVLKTSQPKPSQPNPAPNLRDLCRQALELRSAEKGASDLELPSF